MINEQKYLCHDVFISAYLFILILLNHFSADDITLCKGKEKTNFILCLLL